LRADEFRFILTTHKDERRSSPREQRSQLELTIMSDYSELGALVEEIKAASETIAESDAQNARRLETIEKNINELYLKTQRPGWGGGHDDDVAFERRSATEMCNIRCTLTVPKDDGMTTEYVPGGSEVDEAMAARRAFRQMIRHGDTSRLDNFERKSLSAFSFGNNGFLLPPERSSIVLSCLVDPSNLSGLVNHVAISGGSVRFLIDNGRGARSGG
jgi:HK97 family phage major capsid protein